MGLEKANKKVLLGGIVVIVFIIILVMLVLGGGTSKALKCTRQEVLLDGFTADEKLEVKVGKSVSNIKLTKEISVSDYYDEYGTYYDSLTQILKTSYDYLGTNFSVSKKDKKIVSEINTNKDGVILNNLSIKYNGDDKTTLRYDGVTDLNDSSAIKIGDKTSKKDLKDKLTKMGYTCK